MLRFLQILLIGVLLAQPVFASNPVIVPCPANVWTKVAGPIRSVVLHKKSNAPGGYLYTHRITGGPAPVSNSEGVPLFHSDLHFTVADDDLIDVYVWAVTSDGKVRVDAGIATTDVAVQDQTTPTIILPLVRTIATTSISTDAVPGTYSIDAVSTAGLVIGQHFRIINSLADRFYSGTILGIAGSTVTLDTQLDFAYLSGSEITASETNMAVDGSVTPVVFTLRTGSPSIPSEADITRIILVCEAATSVDLSKFCDQPALARGLAFRRVNGTTSNIFNVKTNGELANIAYDWEPYASTNPNQGVDGFKWRLTFAGQDKLGVTLRVDAAGNLEMLVQDDLTGIVRLVGYLEGHVVEP